MKNSRFGLTAMHPFSSPKIAALLLSALWLLPSTLLPAAQPPPPEEVQKAISAFFNFLKESKIDEAYEVVLTNTKIKGREDEVKGLKKQTKDAIVTYGPILGFELVEQRRVGTSLLQVICLSWSENFPLRWRFTYYRPGDKWRLLDIFVDDKVGELFETRAARVSQMDKSSSAP
ncbi:MAG: hypothetical protein HY360_14290 [Verrucomicrobia bacterium]|nr:hypothetical protein [Verrucomicrobiota bacterium]